MSELYRPSDRRLLAESVQLLLIEHVSAADPYGRIFGFLDRSRYFFFPVAPQLYFRGRVDPAPDLWICSQEL
jgi:hypothetical protein